MKYTTFLFSAIGIFTYGNLEATLIIYEVLPFLILAVGVDNIFMFNQSYQKKKVNHQGPLEELIGDICSEVVPSIFLSSSIEAICFFVGAMSNMPAVKTFSLYAGTAIVINFILQLTCFLPIFIIDIKRQDDGRLELCCWKRLPSEPANPESYMYTLFNKYYAPALLNTYVRPGVVSEALAIDSESCLILFILTVSFQMCFFLGWFVMSSIFLDKINLGLDQKMAVPEDSHVLSHFINMDSYLNVGPPVFFVLKGSFDFSDPALQNLICSGPGCNPDSLGNQIDRASRWPKT